MFPKEKSYKLLIQQSIQQLNLASAHIEQLRREMNELASTLPEYEVVMGMYGVGKTYGPQLIAEIGDVSRFTHREAITAFAGVSRCGSVRATQLQEQPGFQMWCQQAP